MSESSHTAPLIIGRYALYGEIAAGGMATVHFARLLGPGKFSRMVAAKRLLPHLVSDPLFTSMLMDEARIAARIRHPNVVSTLDVISTGQELVVVMDYVHGEALSRLRQTAADLGDAVPAPIATTIVVDALHGLHAAHQARDEDGNLLGLVHRDISPQNLLVGVDGITIVADFGVAFASGRSHETRNGAVKGKISYMAPEQIERQPLTPATDVFAISIVLWELLTGERLFGGDTDGAIVHRILSGQVPAPSSLAAGLAPAFDRILARGLARDPARRYATAREMALELEQATSLVRPSEVGAWVQKIASDTLTRRARSIAKIESSPAELANEPDSPATRIIAAESMAEAELGTGSRVSWARSQAARKPSGKWLFVAAASLGAAALAAVWLAPHAATPALPLASRSSSVLPAPEPSAERPLPALPETTSAEPSAPLTDGQAALGAPLSEPKPKRVTSGARARPRPTANCDPPYSVDASGRRLFKLECM